VSRRASQVGYGGSGLLILIGGALALALHGEAATVASLALIGLGLVFASTIVYLDLAGENHGDQAGRARHERERERADERARAGELAGRRLADAQAERSLALERERQRQRQRHDALPRHSEHREQPRHQSSQRRPRRRPE
jgi:hypothetical protein